MAESNRRLGLAIYRALQRWARREAADGAPFTLRTQHVQELCGRELSQCEWHDAGAAAVLSRLLFKQGRGLQGPAAEAALEKGLDALRLLHGEYAELLARMRATRAERSDTSGVAHPLGQVFVHRTHGYRGVIYGWDRQCEREPAWAEALGVNPDQPFYYCLPDEADCVRLFGGVRMTKYVCQENIEPLPAARITHRALLHYFDSYSPQRGRYVPSRRLQFEYPGAYGSQGGAQAGSQGEAAGLANIEGDANLLLHEEVEAGPGPGGAAGAAGGGGGRSKPRRRGSLLGEA